MPARFAKAEQLWVACFIFTYTFLLLNAKLGPSGTFWLFAVICVAGFIYIFAKLPETKSKSLEGTGGLTGFVMKDGQQPRAKLEVAGRCFHVLLFDAEQLCRGLKHHAVNPLFRQLHGIQADVADLVALLLHRDVKPILLLHGVALALVIAGGVSLVGLLPGGVVERFTDDHSTGCAGSGHEWVAIGEFVTEVSAACAEGRVACGTRGGATGKPSGDEDEREEFGGVADVFRFHVT
jgi:hypothetical protein